MALVLGQGPSAVLFTQAAIAILTSNARQYCTQPLLADPLSQQRMLGLAEALECTAFPLVLVSPPAGHMIALGALEGAWPPAPPQLASWRPGGLPAPVVHLWLR